MQLVEHVGHDVGTERLDVLLGVAANELLKVALFEIAFQSVDARNAQHCGMKEAIDHVKGGDFRGSPLVGDTFQQIRQGENIAHVFFKLVELAAGVEHPRRNRAAAQLPSNSLVPLSTAPLVLAAATTVARIVAVKWWPGRRVRT